MPGSSNFLQWNPTAANQESDGTYAADAQRTGGAAVNSIFPSPLANKLFYQSSTFITALAAALAAKGYVVSDANLATLTTVLGNVVTNADVNQKIFRNTAAIVHTGNPGGLDIVYTQALPAFGLNTVMRITIDFQVTAQTNVNGFQSVMEFFLNGTVLTFFLIEGFQVGQQRVILEIANRGALNSQLMYLTRETPDAKVLVGFNASAIDTSVAQTLTVGLKDGVNTDRQVVDLIFVEFFA